MNFKTSKYILVGALALALSSCNLYKKYELPDNNAIVNDYAKAIQAGDSTSLAHVGWEQVFTDPQLQTLIRRALEANTDLDNARQNVVAAQATLKGAKLSYFPSVTFSPNVGASTYSIEGSRLNWTYQLPLSAQWEIDAFAKILNRKRKAQVDVEMAQDYVQATRSQIICAVANTYYALVWLNQQLDLTRRTSEIWNDQVETMQLMKEAGRLTEAAVVQSRANYYSIMANIPDIEKSIDQMQNTLSLLLHTYPQKWDVSTNLEITLPAPVEAGVPMSYLAVRPDVRAAERSFASAYYATNMARANFYPSIVIAPTGGFTNLVGGLIMNPGKWFIQLAASITAPIFSRGANIAQLEAAKAQQQVALNNFETAVLSAAADVSDAMVSIQKSREKRQYILQQIDQLERSVEVTEELMNFGETTTYLEILTARSSLLSAQLASLANMHDQASALISLYQAVGGGH